MDTPRLSERNTSSAHLPNEIWMQICAALQSDLHRNLFSPPQPSRWTQYGEVILQRVRTDARRSLAALGLTCRALSAVAQPFLFYELSFPVTEANLQRISAQACTQSEQGSSSSRANSREDCTRRALNRIHYVTSPSIASHVRSVYLTGERAIRFSVGKEAVQCRAVLQQISMAVLDSISSFIHLEYLSLGHLDIGEEHLLNLSILRTPLRQLKVVGSRSQNAIAVPRIAAQSAIMFSSREPGYQAPTIPFLTGLLQAGQLRQLEIAVEDLEELLPQFHECRKSADLIQTLKVTQRTYNLDTPISALRDLLPLLTSLTRLHLSRTNLNWGSLRSEPLVDTLSPRLNHLSCESSGIECFSHLTSITQLDLRHILGPRFLTPLADHVREHSVFYAKLQVLLLRIPNSEMSSLLFDSLRSACTSLRSLDIQIKDDFSDLPSVCLIYFGRQSADNSLWQGFVTMAQTRHPRIASYYTDWNEDGRQMVIPHKAGM